ncbi:hypothetical protein PIB30_076852 [Stylosanthes scabra]|uniref:Uncharacterized protein n=1 Tax=Stylosanthes scabra TaxID=79078 RepID=A0ABU6TQ01_9FABA|nr:hypothetical protein [Stylosanthes scabra]
MAPSRKPLFAGKLWSNKGLCTRMPRPEFLVDDEEPLEAGRDVEGRTEEEDFVDDEVNMSDRGRGSSQSSRSRNRGRGRAAPSTEHTPSPSPSTSTPSTIQVAPTIPPPSALSPQPPVTDSHHAVSSLQLNVDSSQASQPNPPTHFDPDNNMCTQAIFDVIELMLNELWINYSEIPADVQN